MLNETERASGGQPYQISTGNKKEPVEKIPTLADLGLDKKTSSLAQQVTELSDEQIEKVKNRGLLFLKVKYH